MQLEAESNAVHDGREANDGFTDPVVNIIYFLALDQDTFGHSQVNTDFVFQTVLSEQICLVNFVN